MGPRCDDCELSNGLCPSARKGKSKSKRILVAAARKAGPKLEIAIEAETEPTPYDLSSPLSEIST